MKNFILIILLNFLVFSSLNLALAITPGTLPGTTEIIQSGSPINEPNQLLNIIIVIVRYIYVIFFITAVAFILFAAFNYLTGGDEPEKIAAAHKQIIYAVIAIAVALLAVSFQLIIGNFLMSAGGGGTFNGGDGTSWRWNPFK